MTQERGTAGKTAGRFLRPVASHQDADGPDATGGTGGSAAPVPPDDGAKRQRVLQLYKEPHNRGPLPEATHSHQCTNPLCGDEVTLHLRVEGDRVAKATFEGVGCAICIAAASLLTDAAPGMAVADLTACGESDMVELLQIPVSPSRRRCLALPLEAAQKALQGE